MQNPALKTQSLARPLVPAESALASALETIFAGGIHEFEAVASALQARGVARPSGTVTPWTAECLAAELARINGSLDESYARAGIGA